MSIPLTLSQAISCSRATSGYVDSKAGVWSLVVGNVPRVSDKGLLIEEARTNYIRNNSMQAAATGTPGTWPTGWVLEFAPGLTTSIVGKGIEDGIEYIDIRWLGTAAGIETYFHFEAPSNTTAASGQSWTGSVFVKFPSGKHANVKGIELYLLAMNAAAAVLTESSSTGFAYITNPPTNASLATQRRSHTITLANPTTARIYLRFDVEVVNGAAVDQTIRIGWPQLEQGKFPTSPIRTTNAAVTRAADLVTLNDTPGIINRDEQTVFFEMTPHMAANAVSSAVVPVCWINGSFSNRLFVGTDPATDEIGPSIVSNGVDYVEYWAVGKQPRTRYKFALAAAANNARSAMNGTLGSLDSVVAMPLNAPSRATIGAAAWSPTFFASGYYHRLWFIPTREADEFLQSFTKQPETFNPRDKSAGIALTNGDLTIKTSVPATVQTIRSVRSHYTGKRYFEIKEDARAGLGDIGIGLATQLSTLTDWLGTETGERWSAAYFDNGETFQNDTLTTIPQTLVLKEWLGVAVDFNAGKVWLRNATGWNGNPNAGTGNIFSFTPGLHLFVAMNLWTIGDQATANFGGRSFVYELPTGFGAWDTGPIDDPVTFNRADAAAQIIFANGDLTISSTTINQVAIVRSTTSHSTGKRYFEMRKDTEGEVDGISFGVATQYFSLNEWLGDAVGSIAYWGTGWIVKDGTGVGDLGRDFAVGEWIGIALDFDTGKFWMRNAAGWYGNPAEDTAPATTFTPNTTYFAAAQLQTKGDQVTANYGRTSFAYDAPYGFRPWDYVPVTFNPLDMAPEIILTNNNTTISTAAIEASPVARSTVGHRTGKRYFEIRQNTEAGNDNIGFGVALDSVDLHSWLGKENGAIGLFDNGNVYHNYLALGDDSIIATGKTFAVGEWVGIALDLDAGKIWFRNASGWSGNPVTGLGAVMTFPVHTTFFAACSLQTAGDQATANFGGNAFAYAEPNGYRAWDSS